jgi:hypothetical protein
LQVAEQVHVHAPLAGEFGPVVRLIVGGIAERADLAFDEMDDLQLGIERLLAEAGADGRVRLSFELGPAGIRTRIGPLRERGLAEALQREDAPGALTLRRVLDTVVDSFGVEESGDGQITVRLEKLADRGW